MDKETKYDYGCTKTMTGIHYYEPGKETQVKIIVGDKEAILTYKYCIFCDKVNDIEA
jgi:hypothetical protein